MSTNLEYKEKDRDKEKLGRQASEAQREKELERERKNKRRLGSFWMFPVTVVQNNGKEMYKKSVLHVQSCSFAN